MTNTNLLKELINRKGLKMGFIAEQLGISYQCLKNKIDNVREFKASEIDILCKLLDVFSLKQKEQLFFAQQVDK